MKRAEDGELEPVEELLVDLDSIRESPHHLRCELPPAWISGTLENTDAVPSGAGQVDLELTIQGDARILVRGQLAAVFRVPCARCLADADVDASGELCVTYVPRSALRKWETEGVDVDSDGLELAGEELDQIPYDGRSLDLRGMVSEHLLLAYPMRSLCLRGEDCRGLCGGCGRDLNELAGAEQACPDCGRSFEDAAGGVDDAGAAGRSAWKDKLGKIKL